MSEDITPSKLSNQELLNKANELKDTLSLSPYEPVAHIEAVNVTPWWGGDYRTYAHDPQRKTLCALPTSETIKGVMLWCIRQELQELLGEETIIREMNEKLAQYLGGRIGNEYYESSVKLHVDSKVMKSRTQQSYDPDTTYNIVDKLLNIAFDALNTYSGGKPSSKDIKKVILQVLSTAGWIAFYNEETRNTTTFLDKLCRNKEIERMGGKAFINKLSGFINANEKYAWIFKLFTVPRFPLMLMGLGLNKDYKRIGNLEEIKRDIVDFIYSKLPAPSNIVGLSIDISVARKLSPKKRSILAKLAVASVIYAICVHGLGKASSRGFGRFTIKKEKTEIRGNLNDDHELNDIINGFSENTAIKDHEEALKKLRELIAKQLSELFGLSEQHLKSSPSKSRVEIKLIGNTNNYGVRGILHPFPYPLSMLKHESLVKATDLWAYVVDEVEALSAIGYSTLKNLWKGRTSNVTGTGTSYHTWVLGLPRWQERSRTGYVRFPPIALPASCVHKNNLRGAGNLRRISNVILYPVKDSEGGRYFVVALSYKTYLDHSKILTGSGKDGILCHAGQHRKENLYRLVVPVKEVIQLAGKSVRTNCGTVKCEGVVKPGGTNKENSKSKSVESREELKQALDEVYEAALEFIKSLLEGR